MNAERRPLQILAVALLGSLLSLPGQAGTLERIRDSQHMTLGYVADYPPFSSGSGAALDGYTIELCRQVADQLRLQLGLPQLELSYQPLPIEQMLDGVAEGRVDILCSPVDDTLRRRQQVAFSLPVMLTGLGVIVRRDAPAALLGPLSGNAPEQGPLWRGNLLRQLDSYRFAVLGGTHSAERVQQRMRNLGLKSTPVAVASLREGIRGVASGELDAFFDDRLALLNQQAEGRDGQPLQVLDRLFEEAPAALALARGDDDFRLQVDRALVALLRSPAGAELYRRYFGEPSAATRQMFELYPRP